MTRPARPWLKPDDESSNSNRRSVRIEVAKLFIVYAAGVGLLLFGSLYAVWRINLLSDYLAANRAYVLERDARWERHIQGQVEMTRMILERLPENAHKSIEAVRVKP